MTWADKDIIQSIKDGQDDGIVHLYQIHRSEFGSWAAKKYQVDLDLVQDAFQDAILALRYNVVHGKADQLQSGLKTYLFAIGKNQLLNRLKKSRYEFSAEEIAMLENQSSENFADHELTERQERIKELVTRMDEPCHSILKMFYYLGYSMEVIAARMEYKSEDVAKTLKSRCIKKIREAVI